MVSSNAINLKDNISPDYAMNENMASSNAITLKDAIPIIDLCSDTDIIVYSDHLKVKGKITKKH